MYAPFKCRRCRQYVRVLFRGDRCAACTPRHQQTYGNIVACVSEDEPVCTTCGKKCRGACSAAYQAEMNESYPQEFKAPKRDAAPRDER